MNQKTHTNQKIVSQLVVWVVVGVLCVGAFFFLERILQIPFRSANDALHEKGAALTLDVLIPAGTHIDRKMTIGEVLKIRLAKQRSPFEAAARALSGQIPTSYIWLGNLLLFFFWAFCALTLLRIFTFMGYARALRTSLLLGGITYYFMPDFSPYSREDFLFVACPLLLIVMRFFWIRRKKRKFVEN